MDEVPVIELTYNEPTASSSTTDVRIENIFGNLPMVTSIPTWIPKTFRDGFAIDTTNNLWYFYDFIDNAWLTFPVTASNTVTLTNKRITKRTSSEADTATPTINTDNVDFYALTALTQAVTSFTTNLSGTPTQGQTLWIAITGTAARAITWGASFEASTVALPTTTVSTSRLDVAFVWNTVSSKWRCLAVA